MILPAKKVIGRAVSGFGNRGFFHAMPDEMYLKTIFPGFLDYSLDLDNPRTYNEKLQWLKLHDRNPIYPSLVDKYEVRKYISEKQGESGVFSIPLVGGPWNDFEEIDFSELPDQFVLKCTHDSGSAMVCSNKDTFNIDKVRLHFKKHLKNNLYYGGREWPYKELKPRIIAEQYMNDESGYELKDYKFFVFNGDVKLFFVARDRGKPNTMVKFDFYDLKCNHLPIVNIHPNSGVEFIKPKNFEMMIEAAKVLGKDFPHIRVDLYNIDGKIFFSEFTFYHGGGFMWFEPIEWDYKLGNYIDLKSFQ